jgi:hypothetical protein
MNRDEKILLVLMGLAVLVVVIYSGRDIASPSPTVLEVGASNTDEPVDVGPSYLTYNAPWNFQPPTAQFLPNPTAGQIGQVASCATCG